MLATVKEELERATKDERIKAVVLRINSPGGTVTASPARARERLGFSASVSFADGMRAFATDPLRATATRTA